MDKICSHTSCERTAHSKGFCTKHYRRFSKYGSSDGRGVIGAPKVHGLHGTRAYKSWLHMMDRCYNKNCKAYLNYGARGVLVCDDWKDVNKFFDDMGERQTGYSLERVDNNLGYSKANCIWADATTQARNRRIVKLSVEKAAAIRLAYFGSPNVRGEKTKAALRLASEYGVSVAAIRKVIEGRHWKQC